MNTNRPLKVFLCHSSTDKPRVKNLYNRLVGDGYDAWLDEEKLIPGQKWALVIQEAVRTTDIVIVCLSRESVSKTGYVQKEIKIALDVADEYPEAAIFLIPARLEECDVPVRLQMLHWVDLFKSDGYSKLKKALQIQATFLGVSGIPNAVSQVKIETNSHREKPEYPLVPWGFRYIEGLDSANFDTMSVSNEIKVFNAQSEILSALLIGDGIVLSENQIADSRNAITIVSRLIKAANEAGVRAPIRVASRTPNQSAFVSAARSIGNEYFILSAFPSLNSDISRRKIWAKCLSQGYEGLNDILRYSTFSETDYIKDWFTTLNYIDQDGMMLVGIRNLPYLFSENITRILDLKPKDLERMCSQTKDSNYPEIIYPKWFETYDEAEAAAKLIKLFEKMVVKFGEVPLSRSQVYRALADLEESKALEREAIRKFVDDIYSDILGGAVGANAVSDTSLIGSHNIFASAGNTLSRWVRLTQKSGNDGFTFRRLSSWIAATHLTWSNSLEASQMNQANNNFPWRAILEMIKEPKWQYSLAKYRKSLIELQHIDKSIDFSAESRRLWKQKHIDAHKNFDETWIGHIEISSSFISDLVWRLAPDGSFYFSPESGSRRLPIVWSYRAIGTAADYSIEKYSFYESANQRMEYDNNIQGFVYEIA